MNTVQPSGLRLWITSLLQRPAAAVHERVEAAEHQLEAALEQIQGDMETRIRRFERRLVVWSAVCGLLVLSGVFFVMGAWLALAHIWGSLAASLILALGFALLASLPVIFLPKHRIE